MFQATQLIEFIKKNQNTSINEANEYKCLNQIINYIELNSGWEYINDLSLGFFHIFYLFLSIKTKLVNFFV